MRMNENIIEDIVADEKGYTEAFQDGFEMAESINNKSKQVWYKSWALWVSILSLIGVILINNVDIIDNDIWQAITTAVLSILSAFGIINNPNANGSLGY